MIDHLPSAPAGPHPAPEELYRAQHEPSTPRSAEVLAHAARCAVCSEELMRQEAFDDPEQLPERKLEEAWARFQKSSAPPVPLSTAPRRWQTPLLLAATLAASVLGLSLWQLRSRPSLAAPNPSPTPVLSPSPAELTRGGSESAALWTPSGTLTAAPSEFVFAADGETVRRVTLFDEGRTFSWSSEPTTSGRVPFPADERAKLRPGVNYYWTVLTDTPTSGDETARKFRIEPPAP